MPPGFWEETPFFPFSFDPGTGVLDALVETAAYVIEADTPNRSQKVECFKVIGMEDKAHVLSAQIMEGTAEGRYAVPASFIAKLPNRAFVYWLPSIIVDLLDGCDRVGSEFNCTKGLSTDDDFRFLRLWWEVNPRSIGLNESWAWFAKGGGV